MSNDGREGILVTGATGQIGSELTLALRERYGGARVVAGVHRTQPTGALKDSGPHAVVDLTRPQTVVDVLDRYGVDTVYNMAAVLSAVGERNPDVAWRVNLDGLYTLLEIGRERGLKRLFCPSSIAVFGPDTPRDHTPQMTILRPKTMYGITKVAGELLAEYYWERYGLDVRGIRFPGIISNQTLPGGGTTDYAVDMFYRAIADAPYTCFVREDTVLPMMYMPDCIRATIMLMEAEGEALRHRASYNVAAMSFAAGELAREIRRHVPGFQCAFEPDHRQAIADSWPRSIDDAAAREDWGWQPEFDLAAMAIDMLEMLRERRKQGASEDVLDEG